MRPVKFIFFFFLALSLGGQAVAETALTLEDCVKEVSAHNRDLSAAMESLKSAENNHMAGIGQFLPQISFGASVGRSGSGGVGEAWSGSDYQQNASLRLSLQQNLFSGLKDYASLDAAAAQVDMSKAQLAQTKSQLSRDLKTAFYQLVFYQKQIGLLKSIASRQKSNMELVEMNYKGGTDNKGSFLQAQATYEQALFEVGQAQRAMRVAQKTLAQILGRRPMDAVEAKGEFSEPALSSGLPDFKNLTLQTPAHRQAVIQLWLSDCSYASARSSFLPTLSANAALSRQGEDFSNTQPGWSAGLSLSFPLFTGGRDLFNLRSAQDSQRGAQDGLESTDMKTESQLESSYASLQNTVGQIKVQNAFLKATQTQAEIAKAQYLNGLLIFQNWNQIENSLVSQQKSELSSFLSAQTAQANWEYAQGKGIIP
jgi:outer membrane protein TolC